MQENQIPWQVFWYSLISIQEHSYNNVLLVPSPKHSRTLKNILTTMCSRCQVPGRECVYLGKYIDGSGAEIILAESKAFGKDVVRSVLDGILLLNVFRFFRWIVSKIDRCLVTNHSGLRDVRCQKHLSSGIGLWKWCPFWEILSGPTVREPGICTFRVSRQFFLCLLSVTGSTTWDGDLSIWGISGS